VALRKGRYDASADAATNDNAAAIMVQGSPESLPVGCFLRARRPSPSGFAISSNP